MADNMAALNAVLARFYCIGVKTNKLSGSRLIMKLTAALQKLQTPSNIMMYRFSMLIDLV